MQLIIFYQIYIYTRDDYLNKADKFVTNGRLTVTHKKGKIIYMLITMLIDKINVV